MGHEVHIYTMHWWDGPKDRIEHGVHLHAISDLHAQYAGRRRSIRQAIIFGIACSKMVTKRFDVIDVDHMPYFSVFTVWLAARIRGRRVFGTWHEALSLSDWAGYMGAFPGAIAALIERLSIRLPYVITANSDHTVDLIARYLHRTRGVYVVPPGVDAKEIHDAAPHAKVYDAIFAGRLVKDKNVSLLLQAMSLIVETNSSARCLVVGSGIEEPAIKGEIERLHLQTNVRVVPFMRTPADLYREMKRAKVFVLPSTREGFGIVVLEALICGLPVVTLDVPANGARKLVKEGVTGSLVKPQADSLARGIIEWSGREPDKATIERLAEEYDWRRLAEKQAAIYAFADPLHTVDVR
jgi:glycosyltransferase involved in cell wall biosynthesis